MTYEDHEWETDGVLDLAFHALARLSFTARIERPPLYRGGSASTKDGLATPQSLLLLKLRPSYNIFLKLTPWHSDGFRVPVDRGAVVHAD